uniref:Putative secreted protein n=1 Tax=Anopheles darlingi TaxID=43151 RepID=A0A2M4D6A5_ANODA
MLPSLYLFILINSPLVLGDVLCVPAAGPAHVDIGLREVGKGAPFFRSETLAGWLSIQGSEKGASVAYFNKYAN